MLVSEILKRRSPHVITVRPEDTTETVATILSSNNIGALPVRDQSGNLIGIISERDIVRGFAKHGGSMQSVTVAELMSKIVITCRPDSTIKGAMEVMSQRHFRHLPVVEDGELCGIVSSRDLMGTMLEQTELERDVLRDFAIASR